MKRILFVDDEKLVLDGIRRMLYTFRDEWDLEFAEGGEAALRACENRTFDVVVADLRMPGMDGAMLLGHIRKRFPGTARIILSGYSDIELTTHAAAVAHRFLAKPCNSLDLHAAVERVCCMQALLGSAELRRVVGAVGDLPSLSSTYTSLTQAVGDPNSSVAIVAQIIERDVAMSAKVLQLVNSAFFGLAQTVTNLGTAVNHLGMRTIKNLVLAEEIFRVFSPIGSIGPSVCKSVQEHSNRTATVIGKLPLDPRTRDANVLAALLHDVGTLVLATKMPKEYASVVSLSTARGCELYEAEEELIGTSHAEIGAYLLGLWGMPQLVVEAIAHHHHPTRIPHAGFDSSAALYVADLLASEPVSSEGDVSIPEFRELDRDTLKQLGVLDRIPEFRELACENGSRISDTH